MRPWASFSVCEPLLETLCTNISVLFIVWLLSSPWRVFYYFPPEQNFAKHSASITCSCKLIPYSQGKLIFPLVFHTQLSVYTSALAFVTLYLHLFSMHHTIIVNELFISCTRQRVFWLMGLGHIHPSSPRIWHKSLHIIKEGIVTKWMSYSLHLSNVYNSTSPVNLTRFLFKSNGIMSLLALFKPT